MRLLILTALVAAVASTPVTETQKWPWQVGKVYNYDVNSYTWTQFDQSDSNGNAFKAQFVIRAKAPGQLLAKLENLTFAQVQGKIDLNADPPALTYKSVQQIEEPIEIFVDGGRVLSLKVPASLSVSYENLLKGLISAIQVDLTPYGSIRNFPNSYDKESFQGLFKKSEADVTGDCETLYSVSPVSAEWRRELPDFVKEDPIEIVKTKNYGSCKTRVAFYTGVPEGTLWNGIANGKEEKQFIKHTSKSRVFAGKQGTIYKAETLSSVFVNPLLFGKQKAEVYSYVSFVLTSAPQEGAAEWQVPTEVRPVDSLLFTLDEESYTPVDAQNIDRAQKLLQDITPLLQNPNDLPKEDFLSKFNVLVRIIVSLNSEQLAQLTSSIEVAKSSQNAAKTSMWIVYRDAVAQAGTTAAYKEIKSWILNKKIESEEAAEVIASIPSVLRYPTKEIIKDFFEFAFNPEVVNQKFLNTTALLAATKLIRYGDENLFVVETVIPRLSEELKKAVEEDDSSKAQVYVKVLGNVANSDILKVFAPYLDGTIAVSKYLRTQIVTSLKTLANLKNGNVRAVLFSILRNTAEPYEVRVAAALNLFLAVPTAEMLQIMAHMTNDDRSTQVRAVLANSIKFAAGLKDPRFAELANNAKAVQGFVSKEKFGYRYSADSIIDEYSSSDESGHFRELSFIGSKNNILPVYERFALRLRGNGLTEEDSLTLSLSDVQALLDYIVKMFSKPHTTNVDFKFSTEKIIELLNITREARTPIEGSFFIDELNQQRLFTFEEEDIKTFISEALQMMPRFMFGGVEKHFTKVLINKQVFVTFPLAAGLPFIYGYSEPLVFTMQSKTKLKMGYDKSKTLKNDMHFTYGRNLDGSVGFFDTFSQTFTSTGIINKLQFYLPIKFSLNMLPNDIQLTYELPEQNVNIVQLSVLPYTSSQKISSVLPVLEEPTTKLIERSAKVLSTDVNLTKQAGVAYRFKGDSYSSDYKNPSELFGGDVLSNIRTFLYQKDIALTQFELKYVARETRNKKVLVTVFLETLYNLKLSGQLGPATIPDNVAPYSMARRRQLANRVASGIESAKVQVVDIGVVFYGQQMIEYVLTTALANSHVDNKVQGALFARGGNEQINAVFKMIKPKIIPLNFEEALNNEIKATYEADIKFGNDTNIQIKSIGERSKEYTRQLKKDPLAKQCLQETSKDNFFQRDCYKLIIKAHAPDFFKTTVSYGDLKPFYCKNLNSIHDFLKNEFSWEEIKNPLKKTDAGKLEIISQSFYYDNSVNYEFTSQFGTVILKNVKGMEYYPYAMAIYAPVTSWERVRNWSTDYQTLPVCVVDGNKISTFSGRSYDYSLTGSWHVVMVGESIDNGKKTDLVILARRPINNQEEVYISFKTDTGKYLELDINPTVVAVKSNANKISEGNFTLYWDDIKEAPLLEYYTLTDGAQVFSINNAAIRIVYDGQRLVIFTDGYRSTTRGICGQSSTQTSDDYLTPWGLVDESEYYGASYSLEGEFSDPKTVELKKKAKLKAYQPVTKYTTILRSDAEWSKAKNQSV